MKKLMKLFAVGCALSAQTLVFAGQDKPIKIEQLPANAQQIINNHFAGQKVALAKVDSELFGKTYDVIFTNGDKLEFDSKGDWIEVECKKSQVPAAIVPESISKFVSDSYPQTKILEIDRDRRGYDVKLSSHIELKFDGQFQLVGIDD